MVFSCLLWAGGSGCHPGDRACGPARDRDGARGASARTGHVAGAWAHGWCGARAGGAGQAAGDGTARWPGRARASTMVTAATTSMALTVIRMICQPGMPVAAAWEVAAGIGPKRPS
jgi:hypothetical protein